MKIKTLNVLSIPAILISTSVNAGAYVYGTVGSSTFDTGPAPSGMTLDDTDTAFGIGLGYKLSDNFSLEAGYLSLGETSVSTTAPISETIYNSNVTVDGTLAIDATGFTFGFKAALPLTDDLSLLGRLGLYNWTSDVSFSGNVTIDNITYTGSESAELDDGTDPYFGVGVAYKLTDNVYLDANWTRYALEVISEDLDVDTLNVGVSVHF